MSIPAYDVPSHPASDDCLDLLVFCDPSWICSENSLLKLERNSNFLFLRNFLSLMHSFGPRPLPPRTWDHKLVSDVLTPPSSTVLTPILRFRLLARLCSLHSPLGCVHKIWNYEGWNLRPNFVTEFVDPVENTCILLISLIV